MSVAVDVVVVVGAVAVADYFAASDVSPTADLPLNSNLTDSDFVRISFFPFATRKRCEPLHNHKIKYRDQSKH